MRGGAFQGVGFLAGDERVSENDALAVQHTLWMRNHNRLAEGLSKLHPKWTDEQTFQRARQINIAQYQNIVMYEWLPLQIGDKVNKYQGYDSKKSGNITTEFNAAGFRYGHTQTNNRIQSIDANGNLKTIPLLASFGAPSIKTGSDVDNILRGDSKLLAEKIDTNVVFDLRNALFPPAGVGFDLFSANIQRGRDRGLADYNEVRTSVGLPRVKSFTEITSDPQKAENLQKLYGTVEDIDLLVGLFSEDPVTPSGAGITTQKIVMEQFERFRDADRFWFERPINKGGFFTPQEIKAIKQTSFDDIIKLNSEVKDIGKNAFLVVSDKNPVDPLTGKSLTPSAPEYLQDNFKKFKLDDRANFDVSVLQDNFLGDSMTINAQTEAFFSLGATSNNGMNDIFTEGNNRMNPFDNLIASNPNTIDLNLDNSVY